MATQKEQKITITSSSGLNKDDIDRLVNEAKSHEAEDKKLREEVEQRNQADSLIYSTERMIKENKDKIPADAVSTAEKAIEACKKAVESKDAGQIKNTMDELQQATFKISEALYKAAAPKEGASEGAPTEAGEEPKAEEKKKDEKVVDAEFEETKDA
jgi:molecular chaperone DnaK